MAMANVSRQQFYQSDRVKSFHRDLLLTETLKEREEQIKQNQKIANARKEEERRLLAQIRRKEMEDAEKERQRNLQREMERKACAEYVKQQIQEKELMRRQQKLEKQKEMKACTEMRKEYERDEMMLKQRQHDEKMKVRNIYLQQIAEKDNTRAMEAQNEDMEEMRRRRFEMDKEQWTKMSNEKEAEKYRRRERRSEMLGERLLAEEREKARREEEMNARALAKAVAEREAKLMQERIRKSAKAKDLRNAMAAQRKAQRIEREEREREEKQRGLKELLAMKEAEKVYWENQRLIAERKKLNRMMMDDALRQQMAEKRLKDRMDKEERLNYDKRQTELFAKEEKEFQRYTAGVIKAAEEANRDTYPLRKAAERGIVSALGPITGGVRANYLVPGANYSDMTKYLSSTAQDIARLYRPTQFESTKERLGFIW
ncbi:coiled-coil domain-containing protein 173-like [Megalops cyprinoides]|uniref:coiled-coil domain-containing protein 173-like n=1 Tax=Megalops cyprinoides TaxID=118141 RepID=UPI0018649271|nr:coiled-coil domain-containing protein 173-like [Megalops cyprinoides]